MNLTLCFGIVCHAALHTQVPMARSAGRKNSKVVVTIWRHSKIQQSLMKVSPKAPLSADASYN